MTAPEAAGAAAAVTTAALAQTYIDHLDELMLKLGDQAAKAVLGAYRSWMSDTLTTGQFVDLVARIVATINYRARTTADVIGSRLVQDLAPEHVAAVAQPERIPVPNGIMAVSADEDLARLTKSATTFAKLLDAPSAEPASVEPTPASAADVAAAVGPRVKVTVDDSIEARLDRFARDEPANAIQTQLVRTYRSHSIEGYVRGINAGACELCVWLRKEHLRPGGYVYPASKPMHRHTGCRCTPIPTRKEVSHD